MNCNTRQSLTTLAALAGVLLLAVLTLTLQTRTTADLRLARLTADLETRAAKESVTDRHCPHPRQHVAAPIPVPSDPRAP